MRGPVWRIAGPIATWVLDRFRFDAVVSPWGTIYVRGECFGDHELLMHELVHIEQWQRDGFLKFWTLIVWYYVWYGYERSPYEVEARAKAAEAFSSLKAVSSRDRRDPDREGEAP